MIIYHWAAKCNKKEGKKANAKIDLLHDAEKLDIEYIYHSNYNEIAFEPHVFNDFLCYFFVVAVASSLFLSYHS